MSEGDQQAGERPGSSWQSWVEASARDGRPDGESDVDVPADWDPGTEAPAAADRPLPGLEPPPPAGEDAGGGDLVPVAPLLPSIAGRVEALSGLLRSITMRIDGLAAASDVYRATVTDRIDEYTETILQLTRQNDQTLEEHRRASERITAELRRSATDRTEMISRLAGRVEELATEVGTMVEGGAVARPAEVEVDLLPLAERQEAMESSLDEVRTLVEVIVDTMPASADGSAQAPLTRADLDEAVDAVVEGVLGRMGVDAIADAVVARLDLQAIAAAVVARIEEAFELVDEGGGEPAPP